LDIELEQWYSMDENGKMSGIGIRGEELDKITPKATRVKLKHLEASLTLIPAGGRRIPSWENLNYTIFMNKYTNHYGHALDLYAAFSKSRVPRDEDEERRMDVIMAAADEFFDWGE
jgi:hypothetical protein